MTVRALVESDGFQQLVIVVIILNAFLIGLYLYIPHPLIPVLEWACVAFFVVELALKFYARESTVKFFRSGWNVFDLIVVGAAFVPQAGPAGTLLRVLRVFRVLRLVGTLRELRIIVNVLMRSLRSMANIALLMFICFYIYAVLGVKLFGETQPSEYGTLHEAFFSLFRSLTGEDWTDLRYSGLADNNYWLVTLYHVSWMVIGTYLLINLVVGAIVSNYQQVEREERMRLMEVVPEEERLMELSEELYELLQTHLARSLEARQQTKRQWP